MRSIKMRSYLNHLRPSRWLSARTSQKKFTPSGPLYDILRWLGNAVGERTRGTKVGEQDLEQGLASASDDSSPGLMYTDREGTSLSSNRSVDGLSQVSRPSRHELSDESPAQSDSGAPQAPGYRFTRENKIAVMENIVSVLLTEDTLRRMAETIVESKNYHNYEIEYQEIKRKVVLGECLIEGQQYRLDDADLAEDHREELMRDIQDARLRVSEDIRRRDEMEGELCIRKANLDYTRGQLDDMMEQLMTDVGVFERPVPKHQNAERRSSYGSEGLSVEHPRSEEASEANSTESSPHEDRTYESTVSAKDTSAWKARERLEAASRRAILADDHFNRREEEYLADVRNYGQDHSRTEIDHFWFQKYSQLTRELIEAEEEYDAARAEARALDLLANTTNQEFDFADEEDDGYPESEDPIDDMDPAKRSFIEVWTAKVQEDQTVEDPLTPAIEWDAESVNMSESVSVINGEIGWRRAIDKWHSQQDSLRAQFAFMPENE